MIGCAADLDNFESMIFCNALHVAPEFWLKIVGKILFPVFCRKDYVHAIAMCATWAIPPGFDLKEHCPPSAKALG